jgi:hypothetical protein
MMPLNFRPSNPEIIMVNPPRKRYGLKHWVRYISPVNITFGVMSGKCYEPLDGAKKTGKYIKYRYAT